DLLGAFELAAAELRRGAEPPVEYEVPGGRHLDGDVLGTEARHGGRHGDEVRRSIHPNGDQLFHHLPSIADQAAHGQVVRTRCFQSPEGGKSRRAGASRAVRPWSRSRIVARRAPEEGSAASLLPRKPTLARLRASAAGCHACHLWEQGTQTVFGEGGGHASV